jgi:hypothetical protein
VKNKPTLRRRRVESFGQAAKTDASHLRFLDGSINCFIERAKRPSFHTFSVSPLLAAAAAALDLPAPR